MKADLHTHSIFSDGTLSVQELIELGIQKGLNYLCITDHDSFAGSREAQQTNKDINIIIGIELSTYSNGESVHILGYFKDFQRTKDLNQFLQKQVVLRKKRAFAIVTKLKSEFNIDLNPDFIKNLNSITRGSIGRELVTQGFVSNKNEAFKNMIGNNCPCFIPSTKLSVGAGIKMIHEAGGLAVLAHPMLLTKNDPFTLLKKRFDGVETIYPNHADKILQYRTYAQKLKIFVTAGTDFHSHDDGKHGNIGDLWLEGKDLEIFLNKLYK